MINNIYGVLRAIAVTLLCISLCSCSYRPIFEPNQKYKAVGEDRAQEDAKICMEEADEYLKTSKRRRAAKQGVRGGIFGGIIGGITGFIFGGGSVKGLVKGAAIGGGVGAVGGAGGVAAEGKLKPDEIKQRYTANCLGRKGYSLLGWE